MKKLKQQAQEDYLWGVYPSVRNRTHKHFSAKHKKSYYFIHKVECREYPIKLRAARGRSLANPWDDYSAHVYDVVKCLKHKSKRRHQYYK